MADARSTPREAAPARKVRARAGPSARAAVSMFDRPAGQCSVVAPSAPCPTTTTTSTWYGAAVAARTRASWAAARTARGPPGPRPARARRTGWAANRALTSRRIPGRGRPGGGATTLRGGAAPVPRDRHRVSKLPRRRVVRTSRPASVASAASAAACGGRRLGSPPPPTAHAAPSRSARSRPSPPQSSKTKASPEAANDRWTLLAPRARAAARARPAAAGASGVVAARARARAEVGGRGAMGAIKGDEKRKGG